ncbi:peptidoglycan-binding protein [Alphaproteobacteria bacterium]|nr:peptidoglycan-binding protein [Alphaproteobacteria bacterium]
MNPTKLLLASSCALLLVSGCNQLHGVDDGSAPAPAGVQVGISGYSSNSFATRRANAPAAPAAPRSTAVAFNGATTSAAALSSVPPNAKPGECWARVKILGKTQTVAEQVLVKPAGQEVKIIPAQYGTVTDTVVVKEAEERLHTVPATYRTIQQEIIVRPEARKVIPVPAKYDTVQEQVMISPAKQVWKKGKGPISRVDLATGEIMCLVEVPAKYKSVKKRVLIQPATTRTEVIPAVKKVISKRVIDQPARVERQVIPAVTKQVEKRVITNPAKEHIVKIEPTYSTVTRQVVVEPELTVWKSILCETNTTPSLLKRVQAALLSKGYNPGPIDGRFGSRTQAAVDRYQVANGQKANGITMDTLRQLGVI